MLVDKCAEHFLITNLYNVKVEFLPPNCSSILRPLDQGIIKHVKANFRLRLIENVLGELQTAVSGSTTINVRQAIDMI